MSSRTLEFLLALLCFVISVIPIVFVVVLLLLCTIYTKFLSIYLSRKHKTKIELLNAFDGLFAITEQKIESLIINGVFVFEGEPQIERIKESVRIQWTDVRENGVYAHPKLRCSVAKTSGYFYWLPERKFSLDDHVKVYECAAPHNDAELNDVLNDIFNLPIPDDISPWMIYVFPLAENYGKYAGKQHFGLIMRIHHGICDGFTFTMMTGNCLLDEKTVKLLKPKESPKVSILETVLTYFGTFFYIPLFIVWLASHHDSNVLHGPKQIGDRLVRFSPTISLDRVKRVGKLTQTTVNDVMTTIITGVLEKFYEKLGEKPLKPIHAYEPISLRTSMKKEFSNKVSSLVVKLPLDENYGFLERLKKIQEVIYEQKSSFFYSSVHLVHKWTVNRFPCAITKFIEFLTGATVLITNVAAYQNRCYSRFGDKLKFYSIFPAQILKQSLGFAILSYNDDITVGLSVDKSIINDVESVEWLVEMCIEEFESLERKVECFDNNNHKIKFQ